MKAAAHAIGLIFIFVCLLPIQLFSAESTMFGPKQYIRVSSKSPDRYSDSFSSYKGQWRLIIQNGTDSGANRIIKAAISVN
jgi:hypothetical protein